MDEENAPDGRVQARLRFLIAVSRAALVLEAALPRLLLLFGLLALFVLLAWAGVWESLPPLVHNILLALLLFCGLASLIPLARQPYPQKKDAIARLDRQSPHRVIASLTDRLAVHGLEAAELWRLHRQKLNLHLAKIVAYRPRPHIFRRDKYGLRFFVLLLLAVGAASAGPERWLKLRSAFESGQALRPPPRLDAWITPPAYTGRAALFLDLAAKDARALKLSVPQGSVFALRTEGGQGVELNIDGAAAPLAEGAADDTKLLHFEKKLQQGSHFIIQHYGRPLAEGEIAVEPDLAPRVTLEAPLQVMLGKSLRLRVKVEDDYGVTEALANFRFSDEATRATDLRTHKSPPQPLIDNPSFPLALGQARPRSAVSTTTKDITSHPFAGLPMQLDIVAHDDAGNEAKIDAGRIVLPARPFSNPLARALVALRQMLALDKNEGSAISLALGLLVSEPEKRVPDVHQYLQIAAVKAQLDNAWSDDQLRAVVERLWNVAIYIEEGDLSDAERALAEAQARLEEAIDQDAGPEEISKLMNDLRQAMANYLKQLQNQAAKAAPNGKIPPNMKVLSEADLERMMKRIEQLSRSGARDAARQQLQNLRDLLSALRNSDPANAGAASALQQRLEDIAGLMHEQQKLMDDTFKERNRQRQQQGQPPDKRGDKNPQAGASGALEQKQGELRDRLRDLQKGVEESSNESGKALGEAEGAMGEAEQHLGQNVPGEALPEQGRALEGMRKGAQTLMKDMQGSGQGNGSGYGFNGGEKNGDLDSPGRYNPFSSGEDNEDGNRVPDEADRKTIQDILDEVKRRLSDPQRPKPERDYLERLLRPF